MGAGRIQRLMSDEKLTLKIYLGEFLSFEFSIFGICPDASCGHFKPFFGAFGAFKIFDKKKIEVLKTHRGHFFDIFIKTKQKNARFEASYFNILFPTCYRFFTNFRNCKKF